MVMDLGKNDPYNDMDTGEKNIRRGVLFGRKEKGGRDDDEKRKKEALRAREEELTKASEALGSREAEIANALESGEDSLAGTREREEAAGGLYTGGNKVAKGKTKKSLKGKSAAISIAFLIFGAGAAMGGTQLFQVFSLIEQFRETFNSMHVSANMRADQFFYMQMDSGRQKNPIKGKLFGADTFRITEKQASKLATQGIEYDDDFEGSGVRVLKFDDGTGEIRLVAASDSDVAKLNALGLKNFDTDNVKYNSEAMSFKNIYANNSDFFNGFNKGSMTWRGAIANWFGGVTAKFLSSNKITRNLFKDFQQRVAESESGNTKTVALELIAKGAEEIDEGGMKVVAAEEAVEDENGEITERPFNTADQEIGRGSGNGDSDVFNSFSAKDVQYGKQTTSRSSLNSAEAVRTKLDDISGKVQKSANIACTVMNTLGSIGLLVTASETLQIIHLTSAYFEAIDKTKAGEGEDTPIHDFANALNMTKKNTYTLLTPSKEADLYANNDSLNITENGINALETKDYVTEKTAMQSSGITSFYGGGPVNPNDPSVQSFNFTSSIAKIAGGVGTSMEAFQTCALTKLASNATSAITSAIEAAGCILGAVGAAFTFGVSASACGPLVGKIVKGVAVSVAIGVTISAVISSITPVVANMLTRDLITDLGGESLGNALTSGANIYLGNTHRYNGGSLATKSEYVTFAMAQQQVIAENAKYERQTRSPFDMGSKYTFMGNLMTQMMSLVSANSLMRVVTSSEAAVSSSIAGLSPTALAYNISEQLPSEEEYEKTCPYLTSIGAVGDAFCNPYSITDVSTIDEDPAEVINILKDNFLDTTTPKGNVKIDSKSDLAKYIVYCDGRNSAFGFADQNIVNSVSSAGSVNVGNSLANNAINSAIGAVPVIGDVIDVISNKDALANAGYVSGESCVAGNDVSSNVLMAQSPGWEKAKYYQRFIEDQSLAETMGLLDGEKSAVTAFLDDYYEENPLDNSYEGILARYSGLSKDNVVAILDVVDYYNYIANYDAAMRYAFGAPVVERQGELLFDNDNIVANDAYIILLGDISFADVRNRSFVV